MPADVGHDVDRARAAERLAARLIPAPAVEARLRDRLEGPVVDLGPPRQHQGDPRRGADERVLAVSACFQQADGHGRILGKPRRQRRAGGSAADDHVVVVNLEMAVDA